MALQAKKLAETVGAEVLGVTPEVVPSTESCRRRDDASFVTGQVLGVNGGRVMS